MAGVRCVGEGWKYLSKIKESGCKNIILFLKDDVQGDLNTARNKQTNKKTKHQPTMIMVDIFFFPPVGHVSLPFSLCLHIRGQLQ